MKTEKLINAIEDKIGQNQESELSSIRNACACDAILAVIGHRMSDKLEHILEVNLEARFGISGLIYSDISNRFKDETYVSTSTVKSFKMLDDRVAIVKTRNTTYLVYMYMLKE
ncbi:hypothetical protein KNT81_gp053 [Proteus phage phiP4-3]|uniref:Uncharacterized protein n=1 Tax=Proteus phage phiP4-3 TaxID=2065203 RepID=A0A2I6PFC2_9CAUD|nr:hypothetical protein KNT81_gp053 [Proteus phage phiP4-3]AUM58411.1 hypothetical protein phiP43_053 [Proteus phage phiP4-3]AZV01341.1 hypothetical protein vBSdyM006_204 [Shigella phage vB_SdyM_006]QQV89512.1 hypothetical protein SJ_94 [Proteus phage SJ_PmiM]